MFSLFVSTVNTGHTLSLKQRQKMVPLVYIAAYKILEESQFC